MCVYDFRRLQFTWSVQYSCMRHLGEIDFVGKFVLADYSAHFHENFMLKKSIILVNFPGLLRKLCVPHTTFLEFRLLFQAPFLLKIFLKQNMKLHTFLQFSLKNYSKRMNNFYKIEETECCMCTQIFLVHQENRMYHMCHFGVFRLSCKMTKMYIWINPIFLFFS